MAETRRLDGKTFLVTGGAGFIGSNFIRYLLQSYPDCKIINLDKLTYAGNLENLEDIAGNPRYTFVQGDIRDGEVVSSLYEKSDIVVHFAAETHVDRSILEGGEFVLTDVHGTYILLETMRNHSIELFIHISTDEVYGSRKTGAFKEEDALNPSSPYSASKAGADRLVYAYWVTYGLPVIILRPTNNYGPYQYPEKFIPLFISNALEDKTLPLYGKGDNRRDWLFVEDHCRAIDCVLNKGNMGEVYNVGAQNEISNIVIANKIVELLGKPESLIKHVPDRLGHDFRYSVDCRKIHSLGWKPAMDFEEALRLTVTWYSEKKSWWKKIKDKSRDFKSFYEKYYRDRK
ncbi:MAG: dTDP-glucose 4,6-dehydratase [Candidatus Aminicenantes bacterium]|nr:dTDP-glucose 4,6-dehydratase [Candidatus Aminicenantes bacterium]